MSDPQRLLSDTSLDPTGRLLLESWQEDGPPVDGRARTLAALGIVSGAATIGAAASLGSIAPKAVASLSLLKWIGLAALVGVVTLGGSLYLRHLASDIKVPVSVGMQRSSAKDPVASLPSAAPSSVAVESADPAPATTPSTRRIAKPMESMHSSDRLAGEIALIDSARSALRAGDDARAENLSVDYETKFPRGTFSEEAEAIRITALSQNGDAAKARLLGATFLQAHPSSAYAPRIRLIVDGTNP